MTQNNDRIINLFEYSNKIQYPGNLDKLEAFLDDIWNKRRIGSITYPELSDEAGFDDDIKRMQKFISFNRDGYLKSTKYVGIIKFDNYTINLLPKIFFTETHPPTDKEISAIQANMLWWLSYCRKFRFPKLKISLNSMKSNIFEVFIYLFAIYTKKVLSKIAYQNYEEIQNELLYVKGRLDIRRYLRDNFTSDRSWTRGS